VIEDRKVIRPHVVSVERDGRTQAIVAARLSAIRLPCNFGSWTAYAPSVRAISVLHDGLLGDADHVVASAVIHELVCGLRQREADVVLFRNLQVGSALDKAARTATTFATRQHNARCDLRWLISFPQAPDGYLASLSPSTRKGVQRTANRLERSFGARLSISTASRPRSSLGNCTAAGSGRWPERTIRPMLATGSDRIC
jgi:hypothetical protein